MEGAGVTLQRKHGYKGLTEEAKSVEKKSFESIDKESLIDK